MMPRTFAILATSAFVLAPFALAAQGPPDEPGLPRACERSGNEKVCRRVIPDTVIPPGKERIYTGNWTAVGSVVIQGGGIATIVDANITFQNSSNGFLAEPGAILRVYRSDLIEANGSSFGLVAGTGSNFTLNDSLVQGGGGVKVATSIANISGSTLKAIPLALALTNVTATIHHNAFIGNVVSVNQTGGQPTLSHNFFQGGAACVRDWRSDPTIVNNTFRGCHIGIYHEESHSVLSGNDMQDDAEPPGSGIYILNGNSPVVEDNVISNYGTGVRITNARAYVRNNTIQTSVGHGILVESNSGMMDIQGNEVRLNGGDGIRLVGAQDIPVFANDVHDNAGDGIRVVGSANVPLTDNLVEANGGHGIVIVDTPEQDIVDNTASANAGTGFVLDDADGATLEGNTANANAAGFHVDAASAGVELRDNVATANAGDGIVLRANGTLLEGGVANGNDGNGLVIDHALDVSVSGLTANGNEGDGVFMAGSRAAIDHVNASENGGNGFTYDPMGPFELLGTTELTFVRALHNVGAGLQNVDGNATTVHDAWWEGNDDAGVRNDDPVSLIDATQCYWGSATGPTHFLNPLGDGDEVVGGVLYVPFLMQPPSEAAEAAVGPYSLIPDVV